MGHQGGSWHGVELRHLAALEAVAGAGSFSGAGVRMGYSQSAVSGQIATLERIVGARLVTRLRGSRNVGLTPEGALLLEHARVINARLSAARADLNGMREGVAPKLRIGTFQSISQTLLPSLFRRLLSESSQTVTSLREDAAIENLVELLAKGELDVAFVLLPIAREGIETAEVLRDHWSLVVRRAHPLARLARPVTPGDLSGEPLVTCERCRSQDFVEGALRAAGAQVRVVSRLSDYRSVLPLVEAGLGCGLVPRLALTGVDAQPGLSVLPIEGAPPRLVGVAWNGQRRAGELVLRVVQLAVELGASWQAPGPVAELVAPV